MKKSIGLLAVVVFSVSVFAQQPMTPAAAPENKDAPAQIQKKTEQKAKDGISFKDGKAWMNKSGKTTLLDKEVTLVNGTRVTPSGTLIMKDGTKAMLKEGDFVTMDGTVERAAEPSGMYKK